MAGRYTDQHPQFSDSIGVPLAGGQIEFFLVGTTGVGNRKNTFSDPALTVANPNPISLDNNGRSVNPIFLSGIYNTIIRKQDPVGVFTQIDQVDNVSGPSSSEGVLSQVVDFVADLKPIDTGTFKEVYVLATTVLGDGGQGHFFFDSGSSETDNGVDVIEPTVGGGRWLLQNNAHNSFIYEAASGTVDAFTINPTPIISTLDKTRFFLVQSLGPNTIAPPTFKVGTSTTLNLTRATATPLEIGDTGPAGYPMVIKTNEAETEYTLINPFRVNTAQVVDSNITDIKLADMNQSTMKARAAGAGTGPPQNLNKTQVETLLDLKALSHLDTVGTAQINDNSVNNAKAADMVQSRIKGRASGAGTGDPTDLTGTQTKTILAISAGDVSGLGALATANSVNQGTIDNAAVGQGELKTASQEVQSGNNGVFTFDLNNAGEFGFYPELKNDSGGTVIINRAMFGIDITLETAYKTFISLDVSNGTSSARIRYVTASPPYILGGTEVPLWVYLRLDDNGDVISSSACEEPTWAHSNEPVRGSYKFEKNKDGKLVKMLRKKRVNKSNANWFEDYMSNETPDHEYEEETLESKNKYMNDLPHPFYDVKNKEDNKVVLLDPYNTQKLLELHLEGESVCSIIKDGFINFDNTFIDMETPNRVKAVKLKWKQTRT